MEVKNKKAYYDYEILKEYEEPDESGYLKPYSGIAIWYLKKKLGE